MIEPCLCGKPTVVGPYTENFRPVMSDLLSADAIKQVKDFDGLQDMIVKLLDIEILAHDENLAHLGERAVAAVERRRGATQKCVNTIRSLIA
jgi:3-deoxy-D-manno-octulosonic-acid transferase